MMIHQLIFIGVLERVKKITYDKRPTGIYQFKKKLKDISVFAEHQENTTYDLGNKITLEKQW